MTDIVKRIVVALAFGILVGAATGYFNRTPYYYKINGGEKEIVSVDEYLWGNATKKGMDFDYSAAQFGGVISFSVALLILFVPGMLKRKKQKG